MAGLLVLFAPASVAADGDAGQAPRRLYTPDALSAEEHREARCTGDLDLVFLIISVLPWGIR